MFKRSYFPAIGLVLLLTAGAVVAQTSAELKSKYGPPVEAFVIRPGLLMAARYARDGRVCEMYVIEARTPGSHIGRRTPLTPETAPALIEELVPETERGGKLPWPASSQGTTIQISYRYENVTSEFVQTFLPNPGWSDSVLKIKWKNRVCE
jgi:hypothetical protein